MWPFEKRNVHLADVVRPLSGEQLKRLTRIVVIDDEPDTFPTEDLRQNGYSVEYWRSLDAAGLRRLENGEFDIVVLDIQGIVAPGFSDTGDGLGVLRRLKRANPSQAVVACSGQNYSLDTMDFYKIADATLGKPVSIIRCMGILDDLMQSSVGANRYWEGVVASLRVSGVNEKKIRNLEREVMEAAHSGKPLAIERVESIVGHVEKIVIVAELLRKVVALAFGGA